jgi:hypothetical protein
MLRLITASDVAPGGRGAEWLYKTDYPRRIDRYIDFFGTGLPRAGLPTNDQPLVLWSSA